MDLKESIKNNKILTIISCIFITFIIYLLVVGLSSPRVVTFYDVYNGVDVSSDYTSLVPFLRYFIEPLVGITYVFAFNSDPSDILIIFFISYVI